MEQKSFPDLSAAGVLCSDEQKMMLLEYCEYLNTFLFVPIYVAPGVFGGSNWDVFLVDHKFELVFMPPVFRECMDDCRHG